MKTIFENLEEAATKSNYLPRPNDNWEAVWSETHNAWQVWGYESSGGPLECLGEGATDVEAMRDAWDTLAAIAVIDGEDSKCALQ
jgi:hypothetical protein